jgi:hypothetical protein
MKDEKLYTQFGSIRSNFLVTLIFFDFEGLPSSNRMRYFHEICIKIQKLINLSKTVSLVEIFQREPRKLINLMKKVVKNRRF